MAKKLSNKDVYYEKNLFYTVNFSAFLVNFAY